mmetsp:Transcript_13983/g.20657  ORF Transcript_13983/g.20657 Transcript_13983/m.20657 type:complete len:452 (-) Transcript_13983:374-1729(-)|eukprot:CAMPEP_0194225038 /NCGR_PEP_ID=MMETSP0156-20130528/38723_1 /TAXON_ID=33649 /ORGANISM="Thalassionema nitzschioides, Strain L26-B" /LENGTH=451 /DNA_ID=CAMNT_0038956835 /DNA_START=154 /DNA_END=1509 /DNA_ORIENTATION=+
MRRPYKAKQNDTAEWNNRKRFLKTIGPKHRKKGYAACDKAYQGGNVPVNCLLLSVCCGLASLFAIAITCMKDNFCIQAKHIRGGTNFKTNTPNAPLCSPIKSEEIRFTLVTQLSTDRLWMMEYHCKRWGNQSPISVAVLTNKTTEETSEAIVDLGCSREQLDVKTIHSNDKLTDYPVNVLRGIALSSVKTSHVMYVDIDFWESIDLHGILLLPAVRKALSDNSKLALVVPAFQLHRQCEEYRDCREINIPMMPQDREDLIQTLAERKTTIFDPTNRGGHGSTRYEVWGNQEAGDLFEIPCFRSNRYEPYIAFRYCRDLPPFQTEFSGYGKNKMTFIMHLRRTGYSFAQLGGTFLVHYPHLNSPSRMEWNRGPEEANPIQRKDGKMYKKSPKEVSVKDWKFYKRGRVDASFVNFRNWLRLYVKDEALVPMCDDSQDDDARLWIDRSQDIRHE